MGIREETEKKVFAYIEEQGMLSAGDRIVAGVSGGADSVCMLALLLAWRERRPLSLAVAHVNHGLRREAGEDAGYVEELCGREGIPFLLTESDVRRTALEEGCSEEDAGRRIRYRAFREAAGRTGADRVAVAHNSDDNAETMLFHLFRGSGPAGLGGIAPLRREEGGLWILRPILCLERREVEAYLRERGISWRRDGTNEGDDYCRNRIRHHILPYAGAEVSAGAVGHMLRTAGLLRETEEYLRQQTEEALRQCAVRDGGEVAGEPTGMGADARPESAVSAVGGGAGYQVDVEAFLGFHRALQGRMLLELLKRLSPTGKDILAVHVQDALALFRREGNRYVTLPFGITARRQYGQVLLERGKTGEGNEDGISSFLGEPVEVPLTEALFGTPAVFRLGDFGELEFSAFFIKKEWEVPKNRYTKWFDYDKIEDMHSMEEPAVIRSRERGDYLTITRGAGSMAHKSLKDYMISEKIPRQLRDRIPVVALGNHVLWLVGWRISEAFKVSGDTRRVLQVRQTGQNEESGTEEKDVGAH